MMQVHIPGKVMLSGEYAVLHGGTAVMVPVSRYLRISDVDHSTQDDSNPVIKEALAEPIPELSEVEAELQPLHIHVDRSEFYARTADGRDEKLGLGGSAAEAVGTIAMRFERAGFDWHSHRHRVRELADRAHNRAQGKIGSGADVAACALGIPIRFRREEDEVFIDSIQPPPPEYIPPLAITWSGQAADTRVRVNVFEQWACSDDPDVRHQLNALVELSHRVGVAWFATEIEDLIAILNVFTRQMRSVAKASGLEWTAPGYNEILKFAQQHGGYAKPTGAGGGDMMLLVGELPLRKNELRMVLAPFGQASAR